MIKTTSFEVVNNKFWILERKTKVVEEVEKGKGKQKQKIEQERTVIDAWVFSEEPEAISKLRKLIKEEEVEAEKVAEEEEAPVEEGAEEEGAEEKDEEDPYATLVDRYNLQQVVIAPEKYNVIPFSWVKIAYMLLKGEKID